MTSEQAVIVIELLKKMNEQLESIAMEISTHNQWERETQGYPRQVTVTNDKKSRW